MAFSDSLGLCGAGQGVQEQDPRLVLLWLSQVRWGYVVLDEGHKIRNPDSDITLVAKQVSRGPERCQSPDSHAPASRACQPISMLSVSWFLHVLDLFALLLHP